MPSSNITIAGNISYSASFPAGALGASTSYYLAYYDTTQSTPAWQTIAGPVVASGSSLTFSGTVSSVTLAANKLYGFAVFSIAGPTATPPPAPQTMLFLGTSTTLTAVSTSGTVLSALAIPSVSFDLDDAGNVYALNKSGQVTKYPPGSTTAVATYQTSISDIGSVVVSGAGEVAVVHNVNSSGKLPTDVWDPGITGAPSRTLLTSVPTGVAAFAQTHDGSLYLPDRSAAGVPQYDVFGPGASAPSSIITETLLPAAQYNNFSPNYVAVGLDGTLYVTEYTFNQPDPNAGLYIYPPGGTERFIATAKNAAGSGPQGVDVDASGNIYVVNNNTGTISSSTCQGDSLSSVTVYSNQGTLLRTVTGTFSSGFPINVAADGTAFFSTFQVQLLPGCATTGTNGIYAIAAGNSAASQISTSGSTSIVLFDGTHKTEPFGGSRSAASSGHAASSLQRATGR